MSRARQCSTVHVVADTLEQATEDLTRDWALDRRARWAIDSGAPATQPLAVEHHPDTDIALSLALRYARLQAERAAIAAAIPPDRRPELRAAQRELNQLRQDRTDLRTGHGRYVGTPEGAAARTLGEARRQRHDAERCEQESERRRDRRHWHKEVAAWTEREVVAQSAYDAIAGPEAALLEEATGDLESRCDELKHADAERNTWIADHPEAGVRLHSLDRELNPFADLPEIHRGLSHARGTVHELDVTPPMPDHGMDLGLGL